MGGIKIIGVRVVGICSKCRKPGDEIIKDNKGISAEDRDIACVNEAFGKCLSHNVQNTNNKGDLE